MVLLNQADHTCYSLVIELLYSFVGLLSLSWVFSFGCFLGVVGRCTLSWTGFHTTPNTFYIVEGLSLGIVWVDQFYHGWKSSLSFWIFLRQARVPYPYKFCRLFFGGNTIYYVIHVLDNLSRFGIFTCSHFCCFSQWNRSDRPWGLVPKWDSLYYIRVWWSCSVRVSP